ncbi:hypothetical protein L1787_16735 [Acuticoccus sp. M5D2P5]|uniref:hypothetical protein n=1 Tax=Acuticoccus kalidii TaxID=2910977 RepID=UPI001F466A96|nr:hypothetical protein [Acuticoccus kalidii]MCF3935052.1 hypothetical protein [Acuticoccus kalidii]
MTQDLLARIEAHCARRKIAESTFGRMVVNDGKLVERLRGGASITLKTAEKIHAALAEADKPELPSQEEAAA